MTPTQFAKVGTALYGTSWQTAMAALLGVNPRMIAYWLKGERLDAGGHIPAKHCPTIKTALAAQADKLRKLARTI